MGYLYTSIIFLKVCVASSLAKAGCSLAQKLCPWAEKILIALVGRTMLGREGFAMVQNKPVLFVLGQKKWAG